MKLREAIELRSMMELAGTRLTDQEILGAKVLAPTWKTDNYYTVDTRVRYEGSIYKCRMDHASQVDWTPDVTPALWEIIDEIHAGTEDDVIPYSIGMTLEMNKFYSEDGITYKCTRDSGNPIYNRLADLVNIYVEIVEAGE